MIKRCSRLTSCIVLTVVMQTFTMEQEDLTLTGLANPSTYPVIETQDSTEKPSGGVLSYVPTFGLWQNKNEATKLEQKDPKSLATWLRDSSVPLVGRGIAGNVQHELDTGKFANVPENIARVQAAIEDLINKKQTDDLVKLIQSLCSIGFKLTQGTIITCCTYFDKQIIDLKDQYVTDSKIKIAEDYNKKQNECTALYNQFYPLLIALVEQNREICRYLNEQSSTAANKLSQYQQILANLDSRKYVEVEYTSKNLNDDVELSGTMNDLYKIKKAREEILEKIILLLAEMNNVTEYKKDVREL